MSRAPRRAVVSDAPGLAQQPERAGRHATYDPTRYFGIRVPALLTGVPNMLLRAFVFEAIVLAVIALFIALVVALAGILHSGVPS